MKTGKILRKIAMLISLIMLITSTVGTTYGFIVTSTDSVVNVFVPEESSFGTLILNKVVEHPFGTDYKIPDNIMFKFTFELGSYYANSILNTSFGQLTADSNGMFGVFVIPGSAFRIYGLKAGTVVKVTEHITSQSGFSVRGEAVKTVTIGNGNGNITFVNTYLPRDVKPSNVTVGGTKTLEGREWQEGDSFTFVLEQKDGENWTKIGEQTVTYDAENADFSKFNFNEQFRALSFNTVGTYTFRIREIKGTLENVDYDETVNHFALKVTDVDMDGKLEINTVAGTENTAVSETADGYDVSVTFNNTFVPPAVPDPDPITVQIGVNKIVNNIGELTHGKGGFRFVLENNSTSEGFVVVSDDNGKAAFELTFSKADIGKTYTYKLSETDQGIEGMTYDTDVHEITVTVSLNDDNKLVAAFSMDGQSVTTLNASFENTYKVNKPSSPQTGNKAHLALWFVLMIVSGSTLAALVIYDRKQGKA